MYAIIADGGRQYKVEEGQELNVDFRGDVNKGDELTFSKVLAVSTDDGVSTQSHAFVRGSLLRRALDLPDLLFELVEVVTK